MSHEEKIDELIGQTQDPVVRATLMILGRVVAALDANTKATQEIANTVQRVDVQLVKHISDEDKMLAAIRGGQIVGALMMSALIVLGGYIVMVHFTKNDTQDTRLTAIEARDAEILARQMGVISRQDRLEGRVGTLEDRVNKHVEEAGRANPK